MDNIFDVKEHFLKKDIDILLISMMEGKNRFLKIDITSNFNSECSLPLIMDAIPDISEEMSVNKDYKKCPKQLALQFEGMAKSKTYYLLLVCKHGKRCHVITYHYLPNRGLVSMAQDALFAFYQDVMKECEGGGEGSNSPAP